MANDQEGHADFIDSADRQDINKSYTVFRSEVKQFWENRSVSVTSCFGFVFLILTIVVSLAFSATPSWGTTYEIVGQGGRFEGHVQGYYGIWYMCYELYDDQPHKDRYCILWKDSMRMPPPGWWKGFQALMTMAFIFAFFSFAILCGYLFWSQFNRNIKVVIAFIISALISALCSTGGVILFCVLFLTEGYWCCSPQVAREILDYNLHWGFYLACVGTIMHYIVLIIGTFEAVDVMRERKIQWDLEHLEENGGFTEMDYSHHGYQAVPLKHNLYSDH